MSVRKTIGFGLLGFGSMGISHSCAVYSLNRFYRALPFQARHAGVCTISPEASAHWSAALATLRQVGERP